MLGLFSPCIGFAPNGGQPAASNAGQPVAPNAPNVGQPVEGWCVSGLNMPPIDRKLDLIICADTHQECFDKCAESFPGAPNFAEFDFDPISGKGYCFCQDDCQCMSADPQSKTMGLSGKPPNCCDVNRQYEIDTCAPCLNFPDMPDEKEAELTSRMQMVQSNEDLQKVLAEFGGKEYMCLVENYGCKVDSVATALDCGCQGRDCLGSHLLYMHECDEFTYEGEAHAYYEKMEGSFAETEMGLEHCGKPVVTHQELQAMAAGQGEDVAIQETSFHLTDWDLQFMTPLVDPKVSKPKKGDKIYVAETCMRNEQVLELWFKSKEECMATSLPFAIDTYGAQYYESEDWLCHGSKIDAEMRRKLADKVKEAMKEPKNMAGANDAKDKAAYDKVRRLRRQRRRMNPLNAKPAHDIHRLQHRSGPKLMLKPTF